MGKKDQGHEKNRQTGQKNIPRKKTTQKGETFLFWCWFLVGAVAGALCGSFFNKGEMPGYIVVGAAIAALIGSKTRSRWVYANQLAFLEYLRQESSDITDYLQESVYVDYSKEVIQKTAEKILAPLNQRIHTRFQDYLEGLSFFQKNYGTLVGMSQKELQETRRKWEETHKEVTGNKTKKDMEHYWEQVEKAFPIWQREAAKEIFLYVRDQISHSFDLLEQDKEAEHGQIPVTITASQTLEHKTGICHSKANLMAALFRSVGIPCGFVYEHITLGEGEEDGYCLHGFNAVYMDMEWVFLDAGGNGENRKTEYSDTEPKTAFTCRKAYDEYFIDGIYVAPHEETMEAMKQAQDLSALRKHMPDGAESLYKRLEKTEDKIEP